MEQVRDVIIGIHSIAEALKNSERTHERVVATEVGIKEFQKKTRVNVSKILKKDQITIVPVKSFQDQGQKIYDSYGFSYQRIPSQIFLVTSLTPIYDVAWLYDKIFDKIGQKIFCLDQVTDVHNGAAIMRTAAFFGVNCLLIAQKGNFGISPAFSRICSGALEHVKIVKCANLSKTITKLQGIGVCCVGFCEREVDDADQLADNVEQLRLNTCVVMGSEDMGISNAVSRVIEHKVALNSFGPIQTLNVSVASALAMGKFFAY
ncbi:MAG: hypothetical protein ISR65_02315 [Bacteriovoracaceae bacterium]|nr:hypothetical protein [Bacteriovoracaceae bacterium]